MSLPIPLRLFPAGDAPSRAAPSQGLQINLPIVSANQASQTSTASLGQSREEQVFRAVVAACALSRPKRALELATMAKDDPIEVIEPTLDEDKLGNLINPVAGFIDDRSGAPQPNNKQRAVASAVGADRVLVATAHKVIERTGDATTDAEKDAICEQGLLWAAAINAELLDRAARAASRVTQFGRVPSKTVQTAQLNDQIKAVEAKVDTTASEIRKDIETIEQRVQALEQQGSTTKTTKGTP